MPTDFFIESKSCISLFVVFWILLSVAIALLAQHFLNHEPHLE